MSIITEQFKIIKKEFDDQRATDEGNQVMNKVIKLVNELGQNFSNLNGGELAEIQMKLAGYSFFLADYVADLNRISESLKMEIKEIKAEEWNNVTETIKAQEGRVKNKEQIENIILLKTKDLSHQQILYETMYYRFKLKISAINDILTCLVQRISELKHQIEQSKNF